LDLKILEPLATELPSVLHLHILIQDYKSTFAIAGYASYVRWGRTTCPKGSDVVYKGIKVGRILHKYVIYCVNRY